MSDADLSIFHYQSMVGDEGEAVGAEAGDLDVARLGPDGLDALRPLWRELIEHLSSIGGPVPFRAADDSWPRERRLYEEVLADPDAFCLVARRDGDPVGYAMVKIDGAEHVWETGDTLAELETLVVTASQRGNGVGALLMDALEDELAGRGIDDLIIGVDVPNDRAQEFYERRGYRVAFTWLHGRPLTGRRAAGRTPSAPPPSPAQPTD